MTENFIALKSVPLVLDSFLYDFRPSGVELKILEIPQGTTVVCEVINPLTVILKWEDKTHELTSDTFQLLILLKFLDKK